MQISVINYFLHFKQLIFILLSIVKRYIIKINNFWNDFSNLFDFLNKLWAVILHLCEGKYDVNIRPDDNFIQINVFALIQIYHTQTNFDISFVVHEKIWTGKLSSFEYIFKVQSKCAYKSRISVLRLYLGLFFRK